MCKHPSHLVEFQVFPIDFFKITKADIRQGCILQCLDILNAARLIIKTFDGNDNITFLHEPTASLPISVGCIGADKTSMDKVNVRAYLTCF
jgi:hypothetical protein